MAEKKSFLMYKSWNPMIKDLDDASVGILMKAAFAYQCGYEYEIENPVLRAIFAVMVAEFDKNDEKYQEVCEKRREAANKRWSASESGYMQMDANAYNSMQSNADSDSDSDSDYINSSHSNVFIPPTEEEIEDYARAHQYKHVNAKEFVSHYASKGWRVGAWPMSDWKASVDGWEIRKARETEEKARSGTTRQKNKFNAFEQRDYDYAALEDKLMKKVTAE